jgi:hypothetical protein
MAFGSMAMPLASPCRRERPLKLASRGVSTMGRTIAKTVSDGSDKPCQMGASILSDGSDTVFTEA